MKIYTKTGDDGQTRQRDGSRVSKDSVRIEAGGAVDELNAVLGLVRAEVLPEKVDALLEQLQNDLFTLGGELAAHDRAARENALLGHAQIGQLEAAIDRLDAELPPLGQFILPGGSKAAALLHVARTVCRRAERRVVSLAAEPGEHFSPDWIVYLNRLGDLLFVLARTAGAAAGFDEVPWNEPL